MSARRQLVAVLAAGAVLGAAGCGAEKGSNVSSASFQDAEQRAVSAAVKDFADAVGSRDYDQICSDDLAAPLVKQLDDARGTDKCSDQVERSLRDVSENDLAVRAVTVNGTNAVATVQPTGTGEVEAQARFELVKEGSRWKLSGLG